MKEHQIVPIDVCSESCTQTKNPKQHLLNNKTINSYENLPLLRKSNRKESLLTIKLHEYKTVGEVILKGAGVFHIPTLSLPLGRQMASLTGRWQRKWKAYWKSLDNSQSKNCNFDVVELKCSAYSNDFIMSI